MKKQSGEPRLYVVLILLAVITVAAYLPVFHADFVSYDDTRYVTDNPHVQSGLTGEGLSWAFNVGYEGNWHPLTWISHMFDTSLFGNGPAGPHALNLLLHLANVVLLFLVLNRMTRSLWKSAVVAALFAVHPMHVESVAWVSERKDVLSTLFWMLTMWAYVRQTEAPSITRYAAVVVFFALGLMSKATLVSLPIVLLLLDYWPLGRWSLGWWKLVREKLPLFAMSLGSCIITFIAQRSGGTVGAMRELPLVERIMNAVTSYLLYILKMVWPAKLAALYPHTGDTPVWQAACAILVLTAISVLAARFGRNRPYLIVGWLWYLIVMVPMIGLVQVGGQAMADRYTYVPFIGLFLMVVWGAGGSVGVPEHRGAEEKERGGRKAKKRARRDASAYTEQPARLEVSDTGMNAITYMFLALVLVLAVCTYRQAGYWQNSIKLWTHTLAVTKDNYVAHDNLGMVLYADGRYSEAADEYRAAVRINPGYFEGYNNLGAALIGLRDYPGAANAFQQAILVKPDYAMAYFNLGIVSGDMGRHAEAVQALEQAVRIDPEYLNAYYNLGLSYSALRKYREAVDAFTKAIQANPGQARPHLALGLTALAMGDKTRAEEEYRVLTELDPQLAQKLLSLINR